MGDSEGGRVGIRTIPYKETPQAQWCLLVSKLFHYTFLLKKYLSTHPHYLYIYCFFKRFYLFSERVEGREIERKRNFNVREKHQLAAPCMPPTRDLAHNPGMCPDWESNQQPFGSQASTQNTEPHQPGHMCIFMYL